MSTSAIAYLAPIELKEQEQTPATVTPEAILTDPRLGRYFAALSDHYSSLLSEIERDVHLLRYFGKVVYLIDADVLRNLIEIRYKDDLSRRETEKLFENPSFLYALPLGAFHELLDWLRAFIPDGLNVWNTNVFQQISGNFSAGDAIKRLAQAVGVSVEGTSSPDLMERVTEAIEHDTLDIERLIYLLTRPNCLGVVGDFDEEDVAKLNLIIEDLPRGPANIERRSKQRRQTEKPLRTRKDHRDAVNLAIAFKSCRVHDSRGRGAAKNVTPTHVLVTQTHLLLDLVRRVNERSDSSVQTLSSLLSLPGPQVVDGLYPVLSPRRAFVAEEFRREHSFETQSLKELRLLKRDYEDLSGVLRDSVHNALKTREVVTLRGTIRRKLERLTMVYRHDRFYRGLERSRAMETSILYLREKMKPGTVTAKEKAAALELAAESFFRVLRQSYAVLEEKAVTTYSAKREADDSNTFDTITVFSQHPFELLMEGEMYRRKQNDPPAESYRAYSLRWPTSCTDHQFFTAIDSIVKLSEQRRTSPKSVTFQCLSSFENVRSGGIVAFTNFGAFGTVFDNLPSRMTLGEISLEVLQAAVATAVDQSRELVVLDAVRVCTQFGDFQLDLNNNEFGGREVFVISHYNIGRHITHLCEFTCLFTVLPLKLNTFLETEVTTHFPIFLQSVA